MTITSLEVLPPKVSPIRNFWWTFRKNTMGLVGFGMLVAIILVAVFAPIIAPYDPYSPQDVSVEDIY